MAFTSIRLRMIALLFALLPPLFLVIASFSPVSAGEEERLKPGEANAPDNIARSDVREIEPFLLRGIQFEGTDVPEEVANAARPFIGSMATNAILTKMAAAMSEAYSQAGIAFFTVVIPDQSFENGVVRVIAAEGRVANIRLSGETEGRNHHMVTAYAERLKRDTPTQRATLERAMSLTRDIPGLKIEPVLRYGAEAGTVDIDMKLDYQKPTLTFGFSNRTTRLVRDGQFSAMGKAYRLLRDGDLTVMRLAASVNFKDSLQAGLSHSTPIGTSGLRAEASATYLRSRPANTVIEGDAQVYAAALIMPVIRSYKRNLIARASLDAVNSDNAAFGSLIATEQTRAIRLSGAYTESRENTDLRLKAEISQGIDMLDAEVSPAIGEEQYTKAKIEAGLSRRLGDRIFLRLSGAGQWTGDLLPANERFSIGGAPLGRAFDTALINADRGAGAALESAWRPIGGGDFSKSEIYIFADYASGDVFSRFTDAKAGFDLGSFGAGLRAAYEDKGVLELELARPYDQPVPGFNQDWRLSVGWRFEWRP